MKTAHSLITHGQSSGINKTAEYRAWAAMKDRCKNKNNNRYYTYGGRGINFCDRWISFENFFADMGKKPSKIHSLDRIDNNGNYEPDNCRWATHEEQSNNRSYNNVLNFYGTKKTLAQWGKCLNISGSTLQSRLNKGWSIQKTLTTPARCWNKNKKRQDGQLTFQQIADKVGCSYCTAYRHIKYREKSVKFGMKIDKILNNSQKKS